MTLLPFILLGLFAGFAVPLQAGTNAKLGNLLGHPLWATAVSLLVSLAVLILIIIVTKAPRPNLAAVQEGPWWIWMGGVAGVFYITVALLMAPRLGALNFIMAVLVGQLVVSIAIDYFGLMGFPRQSLNINKVVGAVVVIGGFLITTRT
ncbi:DMT family transporter [Pseudomonas lactucae]|uniref:DMT family transporter n=1 Tax=Pseudomonas lactucae TaxID=2813360 RepID=A0A9X1C5J2_9PSED|nr:DMT family transporter [Pseudomonas lactucae]MBN2977299.1 DMT family transporter [Pseudomonas lactucae]MBN2985089.1 DMT family transporter [Pseudomonas lactucae]